jgi:hypothetical protein
VAEEEVEEFKDALYFLFAFGCGEQSEYMLIDILIFEVSYNFFDCLRDISLAFLHKQSHFKFDWISQYKLSEKVHLISDSIDGLKSLHHGFNDRQFKSVIFDGGDETSIDALDFLFDFLFDVC